MAVLRVPAHEPMSTFVKGMECGLRKMDSNSIAKIAGILINALAGLLGFVLPLYALGFGDSLSTLVEKHNCSVVLYVCVSLGFLSIPVNDCKEACKYSRRSALSIPLLNLKGWHFAQDPQQEVEILETGEDDDSSLETQYEEDWTLPGAKASSGANVRFVRS